MYFSPVPGSCKENPDTCHVFATCSDKSGSVNCTCKPGYEGDGFYCQMRDLCAVNNGNCGVNATCHFQGPVSTRFFLGWIGRHVGLGFFCPAWRPRFGNGYNEHVFLWSLFMKFIFKHSLCVCVSFLNRTKDVANASKGFTEWMIVVRRLHHRLHVPRTTEGVLVMLLVLNQVSLWIVLLLFRCKTCNDLVIHGIVEMRWKYQRPKIQPNIPMHRKLITIFL